MIGKVDAQDHAKPFDCIIVLDAAPCGDKPPPIFEERIRRSSSRSPFIIRRRRQLCNPQGNEIPKTRQNLFEAKALMDAAGLNSGIIVSDPFHPRRATHQGRGSWYVCRHLAHPTSRYQSFNPKLRFLLREILFYHFYLVIGKCTPPAPH